jgi:ATP-dependent DNA helicase RecQ
MREILLNLIRNNGNEIFAKMLNVDLNRIQSETGLSNQEINETLTNLEFLGILEFLKPDGKETISLIKPRVRTDDLKLNYKLINELYISSKQKLDKMVDFVYTTDCRFKYILNYFGEEVDTYSCGKCDNCLKVCDLSDNSISYIKEKILDLINETKTEISENQIIDVLLGKSTESNLSGSTFFSSLIHYKKNEIVQAIKILAAENKLHHRKEGKQKLYFVPINETDKTESIININPNYERDLELFHNLREAREKAAKKFLQSGNIICSDFILGKIAQQKPKTRYELISIPGFNERMFNKVGNDFLEIINSVGDMKEGRKKRTNVDLPANIIETYNLLQKKYTLKEIAKLRKLTDAVISMQIETIIGYLPETDISSILTDEKIKLIKENYDKGITGLKDLKESLPKIFSYPEIRIALAKISRQLS